MPEYINREVRSDEVQEIMSRTPNWMVRWGITLIFIIILSFMFFSWLIKYPDIIPGSGVITTQNPPVKLITKSSGELIKLWLSDNTDLRKGNVIATIKSTLDENAKNNLIAEIVLMRKLLITDKLEKYINKNIELTYGELQPLFTSIQTALNNYKVLIQQNNTEFTISNTSKQISNQKELLRVVSKEYLNAQHIKKNADTKFNSDKQLYEKGVISQMDFFEREKVYQLSVSEINSLDKSKIQIAITITDLEKELYETKFKLNHEKQLLKNEIKNTILAIENALSTWKQSYQLVASINGKLTYLQNLHKNQFIEQGKSFFAIVPENQKYIAQLNIQKIGFGKVKIGQKVMIKLDNYPYNEYGQLQGKVAKISLIPNENQYYVEVKLVNGMISTYRKLLKYTPEMSMTAEIITEDLRISDRIFNKFRNIFK